MAHRIAVLVLMLALPAALLAACGESEEDEARDQVCDARDDIGEQVDELTDLTLTTATTSQVQDNLQAIQDDLSTIADATGELSDDLRSQVQAANDEFTTAVTDTADSLGRTLSIEDAAAELEEAFEQLAASYRSSFGDLDCS
jgi:phosphoglycerate-specific signal transduction histidine kinase